MSLLCVSRLFLGRRINDASAYAAGLRRPPSNRSDAGRDVLTLTRVDV